MAQYALIDVSGVVLSLIEANQDYTPPTGQHIALIGPGAAPGGTYANGVFTPPAPPVVTVTGNQWQFALNALNLATAWRIGKTKSKDGDQSRLELIARDTLLVATDPLLLRIAANAGNDSSGNPLISVPTVFALAQTMPTG